MNVMIFASDNDKASGAFRCLARLAYYLKAYNINTYVVLSRSGDGTELLDEYKIPHYFIRSYNWIIRLSESKSLKKHAELRAKMSLNKVAIGKASELIQRLKIDVVHINTSWCYIGAVAARKCNVPYIWHIREFLEEDQNVRFLDRNYALGLINGASRVICVSKSIYDKYEKSLNRELLSVIYDGLEPDIYSGRVDLPFSHNHLRFLIVGTISESKGQRQLIEACGKLLEDGVDNFNVKIIGKGNEEYVSTLKIRCDELGLSNHIEFCGFQNNTAAYYNEADIVFVCSKSEAFGRVTVEAMMCGALVIGAESAATVELISDLRTGLLYKNGDYANLANKILYAVENQGKSRLIALEGQKYMLQNMTAEKNAENIKKIYIDVHKKVHSDMILKLEAHLNIEGDE